MTRTWSEPRALPRRTGTRTTLLAPLAALLLAAPTACSAGTSADSTSSPHSPSSTRAPSPSDSDEASSGEAVSPTRVTIASVGVDSPLMRLGLNSDDTLQVPPPEKGMTAGWYTGSAAPGSRGSSVIVGHNDTRYGRAVFHDLRTIKRGADVAIRLANGKTVHYAVTDTLRVSKTNFPTELVYGDTPGHVLRLITCDGPLDTNGHAVDNLIVSAAQR